MDIWDERKLIFTKTIERIVKDGYITINSNISINGIASQFANDLHSNEQENKKREEIGEMFEIMQKYFPDQFEKWLNIMGVKRIA